MLCPSSHTFRAILHTFFRLQLLPFIKIIITFTRWLDGQHNTSHAFTEIRHSFYLRQLLVQNWEDQGHPVPFGVVLEAGGMMGVVTAAAVVVSRALWAIVFPLEVVHVGLEDILV